MFFCSFWLHLATYNLDFKCGQQETERADQTFFIEETIYCSIIEQSLSNNNTFRFIYLYQCTQCLELFLYRRSTNKLYYYYLLHNHTKRAKNKKKLLFETQFLYLFVYNPQYRTYQIKHNLNNIVMSKLVFKKCL